MVVNKKYDIIIYDYTDLKKQYTRMLLYDD